MYWVMARARGQTRPLYQGWSGLPSTLTTLPSLTWNSRPHPPWQPQPGDQPPIRYTRSPASLAISAPYQAFRQPYECRHPEQDESHNARSAELVPLTHHEDDC